MERVTAVERLAEGFGWLGGGFREIECGQTAGLNALKKRWLGPVVARVTVETLARRFGGWF